MERDCPRLRPIPGFPDYYVDEEMGNIWSFKWSKSGRILKPWVAGCGEKNKKPKSVAVFLYKNGKRYTRVVSRLIMNVTDPKIEVDHEDRNIWNNKRSNLRIATRSQQIYNTAPRSKTGFKGVDVSGSGFRARIKLNGKLIYLGTYSNIFEAAAVWNIKASEIQDKFAVYNKVDNYILTI